ncbi:S1 family peptidase [Methylobacterium sp. A49B]|uniref:Trypsin-like serine protease n=1 Tax=Methylobacterium mesophilicum SR1.6/6 TaxID=908290 RepID=A0A6B9FUW8_9HYPH|nr:trypsin-like serine protease [Methylobacterium mesophilicum]QGY05669.1 trypsin-like serine protease [Methylobacterium mesophilicum SR1.6/6]
MSPRPIRKAGLRERLLRGSLGSGLLGAALLGVLTGLLPAPAQAVINGTTTRDPNGARSFVVRIESTEGEICSGTLIAPDLVLSAAHCVMRPAGYTVISVDRSFRQHRTPVIAASMHPDFVPGTTPEDQPGVDLALLKLERPLGSDYAPLDPRGAAAIDTGASVDIAGFGVVAENRRGSARVLRLAHLVSIGSLQVANRVTVVTDRRRMAETAGAGACLGDSGGPILAGGPGGYRIVGVVSWSSGALQQGVRRTACGGFTAVTPVAEHAGWISARSAELSQVQAGAAPHRSRSDWMARPARR